MPALLSLFQKYRSQGFNDLVGQEVVVQTLRNALRSGNPAQVYLFCGPRGTGKTSTARILAKALNCENGPALEPCNECKSCRSITDGTNVDIIELDAASYTGVDNVRDIIEKVQYAPAYSRFKVYIIDEVHMLSNSSFNALLKTLEEPPAHVVFILCTTHPHKLPPTILSRCQRHDFQHLTQAQISARVKYVAGKEGMECSDEAAELVARAAEGSMRDALSQLGAVAALSDGHITAEAVEMALGLSGYNSISALVEAMMQGNAAQALQELDKIAGAGRDLRGLAAELCEHLRRLMLIQAGAADQNTFDLPGDTFQALVAQVKGFNLPKLMSWISAVLNLQAALGQVNNVRVLWEMLIIRLTVPGAEDSLQNLARRVERLEAAISGGTPLPQLPAGQPAAVPRQTGTSVDPRQTSSAPATRPTATRQAAPSSVPPTPAYASPSASVSTPPTATVGTPPAVSISAPPAVPPPAPAALRVVPTPPSRSATSAIVPSSGGTSSAGVESTPLTKNDLGWGVTAESQFSRPAPKKTAVAAPSKAADRVIPKQDDSSKKVSVRDSWKVSAKKDTKIERPASPPASEAELADIQTLWQGFVHFVNQKGSRSLADPLREVRRCEHADQKLYAYLPARCTHQLDVLMDNTSELNILLQKYRSNLLCVSFFLEESNRLQASTKEEENSFINQFVSTFGAEVIE